MRSIGKIVAVAAVVFTVALVVWVTRSNKPSPSAPSAGTTETTARAHGQKPDADTNTSRFFARRPGSQRPQPVETTGVPPVSAVDTNWESRIELLLVAAGADKDKAQELIEMLPQLPEDGQVEALGHIANLLPDEDYPAFGSRYVPDEKLAEAVQEELMFDLLNRPDSMKLPLLLEVARNPKHPKAEEAKDYLELFLEEDYGTNWELWKVKVAEWVKANPD